jgi:hypothetical protein
LGYCPVDIGGAGHRGVLGGGTLGYLEGATHLTEAQSCAQVQAQCLSDLTHGDSVRWHWLCASQKALSLCRVQEITYVHPPKSSTMALKSRPRSA